MKRHLGLLSEAPAAGARNWEGAVDPALILPESERKQMTRRVLGIVSVVPAESFVETLLESLEGAAVLSAPAGATAAAVDALIADPPEAEVLLACGEALVGRVRVDLCIAIDGGRHPVDLPPAFRALRGEAQLVLSEPRLGTARALGLLLERADAR